MERRDPGSGKRGDSGQEQTASELLRYLDDAYNLARWLLRDPVEAEDVVQDAMLRAVKYFPTFRGGDTRPWLLRIVRNAAYDALRRSQSRRFVAFEDDNAEDEDDRGAVAELPAAGDDPEQALIRLQDRQQLDRLLGALPVEQRECLILKELEDLSYLEIARITDTPIGTVMSRLWRARQALIRAAQRSPV